jgi:FkbM family methyltransferase
MLAKGLLLHGREAVVMAALLSLLSCEREAAAPAASESESESESEEQTPWTGVDLNGKALYSQSQEELIIRDFFQDRRGGVFLDVGAATPIRNSNTAYLEKQLDWSGIAIDALPEYAESWKKRRPKSTYLNYLVTDHAEGVEPFYRSELPGISSVEKPLTGPAGNPRSFEEIHVETNTLTRILDEQGIETIDFMSMDIEGHEPEALSGFDIDRFRPELVCIEAKPANREFIRTYFAEHGYEQLEKYLEYDKTNYYFARKPDPGR